MVYAMGKDDIITTSKDINKPKKLPQDILDRRELLSSIKLSVSSTDGKILVSAQNNK